MSFKHIDVDGARALLEQGAVLVDIRDALSFEQAHIAVSQPLSNANLQQFLQQVEFETPVLVLCYHGNSSQMAANFLAEQGLEQVYSVDGGFTAWSGLYPAEVAAGAA